MMMVNEAGPGDIILKFRGWLGIQHDDNGDVAGWKDSMPAKLFSCELCLSVWIGAIMVLLWWLLPVLVWIFAVSGGAVLLRRLK